MAQLCLHSDQIEQLDAEVLLITFSSTGHARVWSEEVCPAFRLLLDPERATYERYRLERSVLRSWGPKNLWGYVRLLLAGRKWKGIQGDPTQLGGDFIVDSDGVVRLAYRSVDPTDRPPIELILSVLEALQASD